MRNSGYRSRQIAEVAKQLKQRIMHKVKHDGTNKSCINRNEKLSVVQTTNKAR